MKTLAKAVAISSLVLAGSQVMAEDVGQGFDVSANVGVVSDYVFRGLSQSNGNTAIQGGIDVKHASGVYAGTWLSSLSGNSSAAVGNAEQDLYVGYGYKLNDDVSFDLRVTQFDYINASTANYYETHASATFYNITLGTDYSNNIQGTGDNSAKVTDNNAIHYYGSYTYTFPMEIVGTATIGHVDLHDKNILLTAEDSYNYWNLGVSKKLVGINWGVSYNNNNISIKECGGSNMCDSTWVFSANKSL
ncbi:MAG TPA: TorF family putative porin [Pseudomonadales bacterium]|nr:TorF family putative porin [Pseudomonadales bacterium]